MTTIGTRARRVFEVELEPIAGSRFQPTGFPDIGAAVFQRPERVDGEVVWREALVVESAQSIANRLEDVGWDRAAQQPMPLLTELPYVRVVSENGEYLTSSRTEAHRLASAFIKDSVLDGKDMKEVIRERLVLKDDVPLAPREIARAIFQLDPLCLVHGVFFADKAWPGQPKIARAVTGFVEALDVRPAISGGVKRDEVRHSIGEGAGGSTEGYGSIPFHRTEWTAGRILASFSLDRAQIVAYGLPGSAGDLLEAIALWEIRGLLDGGLRLRTACDLTPVGADIVDRDGELLPPLDDLEERVRSLLAGCSGLVGDGATPLDVVWNGGKKKAKE